MAEDRDVFPEGREAAPLATRPTDASRLAREGSRIRKYGDPAAAREMFESLLAGRHGPLNAREHLRATEQLLKCLAKLGDWTAAEARAREAIAAYSADARFRVRLAEALMHEKNLEEANAVLADAVRLDPLSTDARNLTAVLAATRTGGTPTAQVRPWPSDARRFENPRSLITKYVLRGRETRRFIRPDSVFMTLGSCFAENLALRLRKAARPVNYEAIGEEVNSTYANRALLYWVERGPTDDASETMERVFGPSLRQRILDGIRRSDIFVLTLGVAPCFFERETGRFAFVSGQPSGAARDYLYAHHVMRTTTVAENVENIQAIVASLERIAGSTPNVVLTVSPSALIATTEFDSAIEADCLSKSTLRLACHEVMSTMADRPVVYWPSFEIVRWLGAHYAPFSPPAFGVEDGNSRHVSNWLVDLIVELFLDYYNVPDPA